jgi:glutamate--cysteine ligase
MSRDIAENLVPIEDPEQLRAPFVDACNKKRCQRRVGTEHEKFGYDRATLQPLAYEGERGIERLLLTLCERFDWEPVYAEGSINALVGPGGAVTLEPGGQLELSGAVLDTVHDTAVELDAHLAQVKAIGDELGQVWCHFGNSPWHSPDAIPWMPKPRYGVMRRYLPTRGGLAHWMMKTTATVQANYDYCSEQDAFDALRLMTGFGPVTTALFANSPAWAGQLTSRASNRMHIWTDTDPDRSGIPEFFLDPSSRFDDMVEYALDVPMFFIQRDGVYRDVAGTSFRAFLRGELDGAVATEGDWALHLSTVFPDVRMKGYLEVRQADAGPRGHVLALPALWRGLLYEAGARDQLRELLGHVTANEVRAGVGAARESGLEGTWRGRSLRAWSEDVIGIARDGLDALGVDLPSGAPSESVYLDAFYAESGALESPSERFRRAWEACDGDPATLIAQYEISSRTA